jgi:hypothetical protein
VRSVRPVRSAYGGDIDAGDTGAGDADADADADDIDASDDGERGVLR